MWRLFVEQSELHLTSISHFGKRITNQIHFGISYHLQYLHPSDVNQFSLSSSTHNLQFIIHWFVSCYLIPIYQPILISFTVFVLQSQYFHCYLHCSFLLHLFFNIVNQFILVGRCHLNFIYPSIWFGNLFMSNVDLES